MRQALAALVLKMAITALEKKLDGATHPALITLRDALHVLDNVDFTQVKK